jgi:hypothetical protein
MKNGNPLSLKLARAAGVVLLVCGIGALLLVLVELWLLYQDPSGILPLTRAVDAAAGLDASLLGQAVPEGQSQQPLPLAYFLAWTLAIVLLATLARVAYWAIRAGATLMALPAPAADQVAAPPVQAAKEEDLPEDYRPSHRRGNSDMPSIRAPTRPRSGR